MCIGSNGCPASFPIIPICVCAEFQAQKIDDILNDKKIYKTRSWIQDLVHMRVRSSVGVVVTVGFALRQFRRYVLCSCDTHAEPILREGKQPLCARKRYVRSGELYHVGLRTWHPPQAIAAILAGHQRTMISTQFNTFVICMAMPQIDSLEVEIAYQILCNYLQKENLKGGWGLG